ncbi:hypothetical protein GGF44_003101, partial [Coemansia sp. RSA 1694]
CRAPEDGEGAGEEDRELSLDEWLDSERLTETEVAGGTRSLAPAAAPSAPPLPAVTLTAAPPTPEPTPLLASVDDDVAAPELEDAERDDHYSMKHPAVKNSILVQRSFATRSLARPSAATAIGSNSDSVGDEPVSYLRKRSGMLQAANARPAAAAAAAVKADAAHADSAEDRQQLLRVAVQLLARINTLYARKVEEQKAHAASHDSGGDGSASDDDHRSSSNSEDDDDDVASDIDELERELDAMNLSANSAAAAVAASETDKQQQEMVDRLAKLGLSSSCVS